MRRRQILIRPDTLIAHLGGRPPTVTLVLLIEQIGAVILWAFANAPAWVALHLAASAEGTFHKHELWQPFTAIWIHLGTRGLILNALTLWMFGSALERWWGPRRFLLFWIVTGTLGMLAGTAVGLLQPQTVLSGSSAAATGMLIAFAILFPDHLVFFYGLIPLKAKIFALLLVAFVVVGSLLGQSWLECATELGGAAAALLFLVRPRRARKAKREPSRPNLQVIAGGKREEKRYLN
jgi:membrane associated rhomboid family serine protease